LFLTLTSIGTQTIDVVIFKLHEDKGVIWYIDKIMEVTLLVGEFLLPCLIVFICTVIQMLHIKKVFGRSENPQQNTANHANLTVFLVSLLYLISVSLFSCYTLLLVIPTLFSRSLTVKISALEMGLTKFTLPLLNAALFPTILILRKPDLKATYRNYAVKVILFPLTVWGKVRHLIQIRRGYTEI
jgi:hypothetical protein